MCEGRNRSEIVTCALRLLAVARKYAQNLKDKYREEETNSHGDTDDSVQATCLVRWAVCVRATELHVHTCTRTRTYTDTCDRTPATGDPINKLIKTKFVKIFNSNLF